MKSDWFFITIFAVVIGGFFVLSNTSMAVEGVLDSQGADLMAEKPEGYPFATIAGGCFWCIESEFRTLDGVLFTRAGYTGGHLDNPHYTNITTGKTGHAEAVEITFDPEKISYEDLLSFFLVKGHDPTQLNGQGVDIGTQYRSHIFYHDDTQKETALRLIAKVNADGIYSKPVVTKVSPAVHFWEGEQYHQQYYEKYEKTKGKIHPRVVYKKTMKALRGQ